MKLYFDVILQDINGEPFTDKDKPVSMGHLCINALLATFVDESNLAGNEKLSRFLLAQRIKKNERDYSVEEVALVRTLVGKAYPPAVVGPVYLALEGKAHETG